ncbi:hypothetical protein R6L23_21270 [Streptomyces sp. SR27]|uniref:hypothetical protein n=1 Tax=Streptomyces sp. SR27 TaxID=3076630 RepID=UPI00295A9C09|nr:hypothetical protein [Streptomyces sp. SR27]MDV9190710.1 hypothetical protein [Streptomyces sp. SR27]
MTGTAEGEMMEPLGYAIGALAWGAPVVALLMVVLTAIAVGRWRRRTIAALEGAELEASESVSRGARKDVRAAEEG